MKEVDRTISWAPMMGYSDRHARVLFRLISPNCLLFTEMVVASALLMGDQDRFLRHGSDAPCAIQLGGSDPKQLAACAKLAETAGYQEVNLNVGCPSDRVQQGAIGACLMADPKLVAECVSAMQAATQLPVTVKCRIGIDDQDSFADFQRFIEVVKDSGCTVFYVHARKAILSGLSPKENREIPPLKYHYVEQIQTDFPDLCFVLNGGITSADDALDHLKTFRGIMMGRAPYKDPYLLAQLETALYGTPTPDVLTVIDQYIKYGREQADAPRHILKHLLSLFAGQPGARQYRRYLSEAMNKSDMRLDLVYDAINQSKVAAEQVRAVQ